ncbi:major facilitator superfamily domain-containing protein 1-like isoform X2 [Paramacrobiotus metropolitanus]|nr:major facilitator superfamily domain-containing protein 1-like isoform X2 [Paramacrobiotus metropolitanus]
MTSYLTAILLFLGSTLFTLGAYCSSSGSAFAVMLIGRLLGSIGIYGNFVVTGEVKSHWFSGKELALAFSIFFFFGRLGSIISFASVGTLLENLGLQNTLWILWGIDQVGTLCYILAGWVYKSHTSTRLDEKVIHDTAASVQFNVSTLGHLGTSCWLMCTVIFFYYGAFNSVLADGTKFFIEMYDYSEAKAAVVVGIIPDISLIAPLIGWLIDKHGNRDVITSLGSLLLLVGLLIIAPIPADAAMIVGLSFLAVSFSMDIACFWSNIPVLITVPALAGVAIGVAIASELLASGLLLLISGFILDNTSNTTDIRWMNFFVLITLFAGIALVFTVILLWHDWRKGGWKLRRAAGGGVDSIPAIMTAEGAPVPLPDEGKQQY